MNRKDIDCQSYAPMTDEELLLLGRECLVDQLRIAERCLEGARKASGEAWEVVSEISSQ